MQSMKEPQKAEIEKDIWDDDEARDARRAFVSVLLDIAERRAAERYAKEETKAALPKEEIHGTVNA